MSTNAKVLKQLHDLPYDEQCNLIKEYFEHSYTDFQIVINTWNQTTEIIQSSGDLFDSISEQSEIAAKSQRLSETLMDDIEYQ